MCRKLFVLTFVAFMLCVVSTASAQKGKGHILYEWWFGETGVNVADLTGDPRFPDSPDDAEWQTSFQGPVDWRDNYGTRARGFVYPPASGDYFFWISGDDGC
jgi:hypothetical protein